MPKHARVLFAFPTAWDARQLDACRRAWQSDYQVELAAPSHEDCPWEFDVLGFIEREARERAGRLDGVLSSSDYPGATSAAAIATRLGLPGAKPEIALRCTHKYYSRLAQREAIPEATPAFELLRAGDPSPRLERVGFPCFVKPVKGAFSVLARRVADPADLARFLTQPAVREFAEIHMQMFDRLVAAFTDFEFGGGYFIAEELLRGHLVTVEGFAAGGEVEILGVVDSTLHPGTGSFLRFDYPSRLPEAVTRRMGDLARRVVSRLGLTDSLFNIEMMYDADRDRISVVELNPRICGQFGDLYQKVDGWHSYEVALAVATGRRPRLARREGAFRVASSFPLRAFEPVRVQRAPGAERVAEVEGEVPGALVWCECEPGQTLADFTSLEDGWSARYGVVNLGAGDAAELRDRFERVHAALGFELAPLAPAGAR